MGLFGGSSKQSGAQSTGAASGGFGEFAPKNNITLGNSFGLPSVDLTNPYELGAVLVIGLAGFWAYKRFKS